MSHPVPTHPPLAARPTREGASLFMLGWVALLWVLEIVDQLFPFLGLDAAGITPRDPGDLYSVFTAPFVHYGFSHLIANTVPFFVLGLLILLSGVRTFVVATGASVLASGLAVWLLSAPGTLTAGASGVVFGWLAFVLARGLFTANLNHLLIGVVVFAIYGGVLWGVFPTAPGVSWLGHLGGAIGGVLAAWWLSRRGNDQSAIPQA
ncbi:rhomboid family intramembrane serine protease [Propioniciclava soli]|uniref:Rhomboid family intramembrane serine protease n=2 Tax=Propioniciclava soli TaxID=2775081 RepID=A0ABZ3C4Q6_9ACTN|nr:rhomboid family intramembrane serine protease [Propioniciclava soli]